MNRGGDGDGTTVRSVLHEALNHLALDRSETNHVRYTAFRQVVLDDIDMIQGSPDDWPDIVEC